MILYSELTDADLADLLRSGDHAAYTQLYLRYSGLLFVHAYKRLRDEEQAKDIVQDFFTVLWHKRESLALTSSLSGYFFTAINYRIIDHFLHRDVQGKYIDAFSGFLDTTVEKTDHLVREKQLTALIEKEINALPDKMRRVFELSRKGNLSHREIAEILSISEKTVDRQISNALLRLRMRLGLVLVFVALFRRF